MKPVIVKCPIVPEGICINLFGTMWARDTSWLDDTIINHERIHTAQQRELLFVPFYIIYVLEWLWLLVRLRSWRRAYYAISFEREAYGHGSDPAYLQTRRHYSQWRTK